MSKLDKIIGFINLIYPLFIGILGPSILGFLQSTLGLVGLLLFLVFLPFIWGFLNSIKYLRKKSIREYSFLEMVLIFVPMANVTILLLAFVLALVPVL